MVFEHPARFGRATFEATARFGGATFQGIAWFELTTFCADAVFQAVTFDEGARFEGTTFAGEARFEGATFVGDAGFGTATFASEAGFGWTTFEALAFFEGTTFQHDVQFQLATFKTTPVLGSFRCAGQVVLSSGVFGGPVTLSFAARRLECQRTRWHSTAEVRLRYAMVDFARAVFEYPLTITAEPDPFVLVGGEQLAEDLFTGAPDAAVRMASLRGVDAAHLVLANVDLQGCLFTGTVHLDQLRLEGICSFATVPARMHWRARRPVRFTRRRVLAEEHHWRARQTSAVRGWNVGVFGAGQVGPEQLEPVYRQLRKAVEDGKNEPGAADFYYGEMEMRRHGRAGVSRAERGLVHGYWVLSGYGLRASRALGWLVAAMLVSIVLLMGFGLPKNVPQQEVSGTVPPGGGRITFEIDTVEPQNPTGHRFTGDRFERALNVTLNSVVFRSSGQDLTTAGIYVEMASRVMEPILLGLAVLAVRNRLKR
ncbi:MULTISPECIES: pentapeptide repeat-containing protein [unclassified Streptomyces]|uniref:pentapeptide repeat-containing protein n=1 Tax=unclassified Streptomyces TaxID=2593676 RepID=UPI002E19A89A|nr:MULTISPECIES: pentapeptide repeat-containing protein [unclassified Streptomyces]